MFLLARLHGYWLYSVIFTACLIRRRNPKQLTHLLFPLSRQMDKPSSFLQLQNCLSVITQPSPSLSLSLARSSWQRYSLVQYLLCSTRRDRIVPQSPAPTYQQAGRLYCTEKVIVMQPYVLLPSAPVCSPPSTYSSRVCSPLLSLFQVKS